MEIQEIPKFTASLRPAKNPSKEWGTMGGVCCPLSHADAAMLARHKLAHQPPVNIYYKRALYRDRGEGNGKKE
jgi:hypothetical protein